MYQHYLIAVCYGQESSIEARSLLSIGARNLTAPVLSLEAHKLLPLFNASFNCIAKSATVAGDTLYVACYDGKVLKFALHVDEVDGVLHWRCVGSLLLPQSHELLMLDISPDMMVGAAVGQGNTVSFFSTVRGM